MRIIRLSTHPTDPDIVVLNTPPDLAQQMGRFEPARYDPDRRAYLAHRDTLDALASFARTVNAHVVDERRKPAGTNPIHECGECGQPGSAAHPPRYCPACGSDWRPVTIEDIQPTVAYGTCRGCGRQQIRRFPHCTHCGGAMAYATPEKRVIARPKRANPIPLGEALAETMAELEANQQESA